MTTQIQIPPNSPQHEEHPHQEHPMKTKNIAINQMVVDLVNTPTILWRLSGETVKAWKDHL